MRSILVLLTFSCAFAGEWTKSYNVGSSPDLEVRCDDASIAITPGSGSRVEAKVVTRGWEIKPGEVEIIESQDGERVSMHVKLPRRTMSWGGNRSVQVFLSVPSSLRLRAATGDGSIRASNVGGDLRLNTGDGSIAGSGLDGSLEAKTGDGSINVEGRFDVLSLNTGDGSIDVRIGQGSTMKSGWRIETGDGSVRVVVPRDLNADLDARTGDGRLTVNVPGLAHSGSHKQHLTGRMNGGGMPFRVRTGDGSMNISAR